VRLWSLHPRLLDARGLVALWREALLAQKVLRGETRGYRAHPQLQRFRESSHPLRAIGCFLRGVREEAAARGYRFDARKIRSRPGPVQLTVTRGQLELEARHLRAKLAARSPRDLARLAGERPIPPHPLFRVVPGGIAPWERNR
jgi:hypothetical protein